MELNISWSGFSFVFSNEWIHSWVQQKQGNLWEHRTKPFTTSTKTLQTLQVLNSVSWSVWSFNTGKRDLGRRGQTASHLYRHYSHLYNTLTQRLLCWCICWRCSSDRCIHIHAACFPLNRFGARTTTGATIVASSDGRIQEALLLWLVCFPRRPLHLSPPSIPLFSQTASWLPFSSPVQLGEC